MSAPEDIVVAKHARDGRRAALADLARALRREAHNLSAWPGLVWQQTANWLLGPDVGTAASALADLLERERRRRERSGVVWAQAVEGTRECPALQQTLLGDEGGFRTCAFAPDSVHVAAAGGTRWTTGVGDTDVRVWDVCTGREVRSLSGHTEPVTCCAFSPDGALLATAAEDATVRIWSVDDGAELLVFRGHEGEVAACTFSPDGDSVVSAGKDGTLRLWDAKTGAHIAAMRLSRNRMPQFTGELGGPRPEFTSVAFSVGGESVVAGWSVPADCVGNLLFWNLTEGTSTSVERAHQAPIPSCRFSPDGRGLLTAGGTDGETLDGSVTLRDARTGEAIAQLPVHMGALPGHMGYATSAAFSPDGSKAISAGTLTLHVSDTATGEPIGELWGEGANDCDVSPDGALVASVSGRRLRIWRLDEARPDPRRRRESVELCRVSPSGSQIALVHTDVFVGILDTAAPGEIREVVHGLGIRPDVCLSPDGRCLATTSIGPDVVVYSVETGDRVAHLQCDSRAQTCSYSPDGALLVVGCERSLWVFEMPSTDVHLRVDAPCHSYLSRCAFSRFSPDKRRVAAGWWLDEREARGHAVALWDTWSGDLLTTPSCEPAGVRCGTFSPEGTLLLGTASGSLQLWRCESAWFHLSIDARDGSQTSCGFSQDGSLIVATGRRAVHVFEASGGTRVSTYPRSTLSASFGADRGTIYCGGQDGLLELRLRGMSGTAAGSDG